MSERFVREQNSSPMKFRLESSALIDFTRMALDGLRLLSVQSDDFVSLWVEDRAVLLHNTFKRRSPQSGRDGSADV